jgi:TPR repeat protein
VSAKVSIASETTPRPAGTRQLTHSRSMIALAAGMLATIALSAAAGPRDDGQLAAERGDYGAALRAWRPLAQHGDAAAQYDLGLMYADHRGVPQDYRQAMTWYRKAADQGYARAQDAIGDMYYLAVGVAQDLGQAAKGYRPAQTSLGILYANGSGVPRDYVQAYMWFTLAIAADTASDVDPQDVARSRRLVAAKMSAAEIAQAQVLASEWVGK